MENGNTSKKKWPVWRILIIVAMVAIFGARMYIRNVQKEKERNQMRMMEDLNRQQMEEQRKRTQQLLDESMEESRAKLKETQQNLDSIGKVLERNKAKFDSSIKAAEPIVE